MNQKDKQTSEADELSPLDSTTSTETLSISSGSDPNDNTIASIGTGIEIESDESKTEKSLIESDEPKANELLNRDNERSERRQIVYNLVCSYNTYKEALQHVSNEGFRKHEFKQSCR